MINEMIHVRDKMVTCKECGHRTYGMSFAGNFCPECKKHMTMDCVMCGREMPFSYFLNGYSSFCPDCDDDIFDKEEIEIAIGDRKDEWEDDYRDEFKDEVKDEVRIEVEKDFEEKVEERVAERLKELTGLDLNKKTKKE